MAMLREPSNQSCCHRQRSSLLPYSRHLISKQQHNLSYTHLIRGFIVVRGQRLETFCWIQQEEIVMIAAVHAAAHIAISYIPITWNLPVSFGLFRQAERAVQQVSLRPVTAQDLDLDCSSPSKEHRTRRRGTSHGPIYKRCNDFLEKALESALASTAKPFVAETQTDTSTCSAVNSATLKTKQTRESQTDARFTVTSIQTRESQTDACSAVTSKQTHESQTDARSSITSILTCGSQTDARSIVTSESQTDACPAIISKQAREAQTDACSTVSSKKTCSSQTDARSTVTSPTAMAETQTDAVRGVQKLELADVPITDTADITTLTEPAETSVSTESASLSSDEAVMDDVTTINEIESEDETVFYISETSSNCSTPADSPWGSLEPDTSISKDSTEALTVIPSTMPTDDTTVAEPAETSLSTQSDLLSSDEFVMDDEVTRMGDSKSDTVLSHIDEVSSNHTTPAASPWGSLEPDDSICEDSTQASIHEDSTELPQASASTVQHTGARADLSINRKENGELELIGKGTFGSVFKGSYRGSEVAIKLTAVPTFRKETEGQVFGRIGNHKNVISLHTFFRDGFGADKLETLVLDYAPSDVSKMVNVIANDLCLNYIAFVVDCLADALGYIHKRGYAHLDVSPGNVLLMHDGVPKLADFSSSLKWKIGDEPLEVYPVGTVGFRAPEVIEHLGYDTGADWFSLGVLIFYMINARLPWERNDADQMVSIRNGKPGLKDALPKSFCSLVSDFLSDVSDLRITEDVLSFLDGETEL